jgi:hypothetical protein
VSRHVLDDRVFEDGKESLHPGEEATMLPYIEMAHDTGHRDEESASKARSLIAEGEIILIEPDAAFRLYGCGLYHNQDCLVTDISDRKTVEIGQQANSFYAKTACLATPEKTSGVREQRLSVRAGRNF